jgi:hypothetical protein
MDGIDQKEKERQLMINGNGENSPMKNPYLKSIEAISKFKIKG